MALPFRKGIAAKRPRNTKIGALPGVSRSHEVRSKLFDHAPTCGTSATLEAPFQHAHTRRPLMDHTPLSKILKDKTRSVDYDPPCKRGDVPVAREQRRLAAILAADVVRYARPMARAQSPDLLLPVAPLLPIESALLVRCLESLQQEFESPYRLQPIGRLGNLDSAMAALVGFSKATTFDQQGNEKAQAREG